MANGSSITLMGAAAIIGSLALTATGASAQAIYGQPYPVVVVPGSPYVVREVIAAPPPIIRERTVVVTRPAYLPAPLPPPRYGYVEERYVVSDW
jgi:hypothetical protein